MIEMLAIGGNDPVAVAVLAEPDRPAVYSLGQFVSAEFERKLELELPLMIPQ